MNLRYKNFETILLFPYFSIKKIASRPASSKSSSLRVNKDCPPEKEINILLLGQTGVGKTTFINSLANYFINDTLDDAMNEELKVIIPTSFSFTDSETFEQNLVNIGQETNHEKFTENGQSCTQQCQSFVFPIGKRNLRLIDTPGMGDTRGSEHDKKNLFEILTYISHYEHLNGICIFLKPNEERLTIAFRLCIKQILHYLHTGASENIIFIFTNARSTFFTPGSSKKLLQGLLDDYQEKNNLEIPFSKKNTFLLDNEPFRYLALCKNGMQFNDEQIETYKKSWDYTGKEYQRLIVYISERHLLAITDTLSLNEAEQLIRKLSRPIAETMRLIQQNIQLANDYEQNLRAHQQSATHEFLQKIVQVVPLQHPRLICVSKNCLRIIMVNNEKKVEYAQICQEKSYLNGVVQETINDPRVEQCEVIKNETDGCTRCGCSWHEHMHITYEYRTNLIPRDMNTHNEDHQSLLKAIDHHIKDLRKEQTMIEDIYSKLSKFLYVNAIYPCKDNILDYLQLFSREEQMKNKQGVQNDDIITGLVEITTKYESDMDIFKKTLAKEKDFTNSTDLSKPDDIFTLVGTLYRLPINGQSIRDQVNVLKMAENRTVKQQDKNIKLPEKASSSQMMTILNNVVSSRL